MMVVSQRRTPTPVSEAMLAKLRRFFALRGNAVPQQQIAARDHCVPMVGAHHPNVIGQQFFEFVGRSGYFNCRASPEGEVVAGCEGVGVVGAQHPNSVGQQPRGLLGGAGVISALALPNCQHEASAQRVGMVGPKHPALVGE